MTPQERLNYLLETEFIADTTLYTGKSIFNKLVAAFGEEAAEGYYRLVAGTLDAAAAQDPLVKDADSWLNSDGLDFSLPSTQRMIEQLAVLGQWPNEVRDVIKAMGGTNRFNWQKEDYESEPTLEQIEAELNQAALNTFSESLIQRVSAAINLATVANGASQASIKAAAVAEAGA